MKLSIMLAVSLFAVTLLCPSWVNANPTPTPTPVRRIVVPKGPTVPPVGSKPAGGRTTPAQQTPVQQAATVSTWRPVMSIEEVKFDQPPMIKVLVMNRGKQKNKPTEFATVTMDLWLGNASDLKSFGVQMMFWVTGKPKPHPAGLFGGKALTQQQIDAMPATTKIKVPFQKVITVPPLAPGESVWVTADFTLPDPGTYAGPFPPSKYDLPKSPSAWGSSDPGYIDGSQLNECANLTGFFGSYIKLAIGANFRRVMAGESFTSPPVVGKVTPSFGRQLPQAYLNFMNMPANKYTGKCK